MDYQRIVLYAGILIVSFFLWNAWQTDHSKHMLAQQKEQKALVKQDAVPETKAPTDSAQQEQPAAQPPIALKTYTKTPSSRLVKVKTDVLDINIDTQGGNVVRAALPKYPKELKTPDIPYSLLNDNPSTLYVAQSALVGLGDLDSPSFSSNYKVQRKDFSLANGEKSLTVDLLWKGKNGLSVIKRYTFERGSYLIHLSYIIMNQGAKTWNGNFVAQLTRKEVKPQGNSLFHIHSFTGSAISSPEKRYEEISFKEMHKTDLDRMIKGGWAAMIQRYFLGAWVPSPQKTYSYFSQATPSGFYTIGFKSPLISVKPGGKATIGARLYTGPENPDVLKQIAPGLELTVNYGWLWFLAIIIFWILEKINLVVGNWGWSIIIVTILIKLVFYHLSTKSYSSMAKMRRLQPRIEALRERFAGDKQKLSQATMELYKKKKVNPLGGCLPIIVQIPVFFALYMVLIESVALRQAPWILWIRDLASPDPFYVLPILMGITMFVQQKLNPPPPDPMQAKLMLFLLPVVFTVLFIHFPAGLVLYWTVNNALSILQQWHVMRKLDLQEAKKK